MTRRNRLGWKAAVGSALAAVALIATPIAASAASTDGSSTSECSIGQHLGDVWAKLPSQLRDDLRGVRDLPAGDRADRLREIRDEALAGDYGDGVQTWAERARGHGLLRWAAAPDDLKAALKDVAAAAPADRPALLKQIADDALAGTYGDRAKQAAERLQSSDAWQNCVAGSTAG